MLAAFVNALTLVVIAVWIGVEAVIRFASPVAVQPHVMMGVATAGVLMKRGDRGHCCGGFRAR